MSAFADPRFDDFALLHCWIVSARSLLQQLAQDCPQLYLFGVSLSSRGLYYATNFNAVSLVRPYVATAMADSHTWKALVHLSVTTDHSGCT